MQIKLEFKRLTGIEITSKIREELRKMVSPIFRLVGVKKLAIESEEDIGGEFHFMVSRRLL